MSLLFRAATLTDLEDVTRRRFGTFSGQVVTNERAMRHSAVWGSLAAISEAFLSLPLQEERKRDGTAQLVDPPAWLNEPAPDTPWQSWIWQQVWTLASRGRCYGMVTQMDAQGYPLSVVPIPDDSVTWRFDRGRNRWRTYVEQKEVERWPVGALWHCPLYVMPGRPQGMSPIAFHAETIGVGLAAQEFGARFFGDGGHPTMVIESDKDPGPAGAIRLKERILEVIRGSREPLVLPKGTKLQQWQISPEESQFLDTMRYSGEDVARVFGVKPSKLGLAVSGQNVTYSNVTDENADWRVSGLARYTGMLEASLSMLLPAGRNRSLRFNFKGFLRADAETRYKIYELAAKVGTAAGTPVMLPNEMRLEEGLLPLEGGDAFARALAPEPTQTREGP